MIYEIGGEQTPLSRTKKSVFYLVLWTFEPDHWQHLELILIVSLTTGGPNVIFLL